MKHGAHDTTSRGRPLLATSAASSAEDMTRRMICGGIAGMVAKTATNPLDRIRMLSQTGEHGMGKRPVSVGTLYREILRTEGITGLWAGNGANLLRVFPAKAVVFSSNDYYRTIFLRIQQLYQNPSHDSKLSTPYAFLAGGCAGMTATALTYPLGTKLLW
jgi:solute carrier family 25 (mitochondrial phosphate transporter), member 23/24/25/41